MLGISPNPAGPRPMSAVAEARAHVRALMSDREPVKAALPRIARRIRVSARRLRSIWEGTTATIRAEELDALRAARAAAAERALTQDLIENARILEEQAARLAVVDADAHWSRIAEMRDLALRARALARGEG